MTRQAALQSFTFIPAVSVAITSTPAFNGGMIPTSEKPVILMRIEVPKLILFDPMEYLPAHTDMPAIRVQAQDGATHTYANDAAVESVMLGGLGPQAIKTWEVVNTPLRVLPE